MCLLAWNWQPASAVPLLLLSNRDEFYGRAALPLHRWEGGEILAGRDLEGNGTWLGISASGRLAALTNFRSGQPQNALAPSRGELVTRFLQSNFDCETFLRELRSEAEAYNPFNLLVFDGNTLQGMESRGALVVNMAPGIGALSNAGFNTPWPKVRRITRGLQALATASTGMDEAALLDLLADRTMAPDADLPQTGVPLALERMLSPCFIQSSDYGTRASSVIMLERKRARFTECTFDSQGPAGKQSLVLNW